MLTAVNGHYNGHQIVVDDRVNFSFGQKVIITILETNVTGTDDFLKSEKKLKEIASLRDGWNGNGAEAFSRKLIHKVYTLLLSLDRQPEIFPTACDTIQLEYDYNDKHLEIEIDESETAEMFLVDKDGTEQNDLISSDAQTINMIVRRFYGK